jgi:hypothetical protein
MHIQIYPSGLRSQYCCPTNRALLELYVLEKILCVASLQTTDLGGSILTTTAPLYLSELVPAHVRARSVGFCVAGSSALGIVRTTIVWATARMTNSRQYLIPLAIQAALPVFFGLLTIFCTESPLWELQIGHTDRAYSHLAVLRRGSAEPIRVELTAAQAAIIKGAKRQKHTKFFDILHPEHLKRTLTAGAMLCLSQVGGQILVLAVRVILL